MNNEEQKARIDAIEAQRVQDQRAQEVLEIMKREEAFLAAYPTADAQTQIIEKFGRRFPMLGTSGTILRNLALGEWWAEHSK